MKIIRYTILLFLVIGFGSLQAQSPVNHYSLFDYALLSLNPAQTGSYEGSIRVGGIYRDQWRSITSDAFTTPSFFVDAPILAFGKKKTNWLGVGGSLFSDRAGSGGLGYTSFMGSVAVHLAANKKGTSIFTIGAQLGSVQRRVDQAGLRFFDEVSGATSSSMDRNNILDETSFTDVGAGILFKSRLNKTTVLELGASVGHIIQPEYNLLTSNVGQAGQLPIEIIIHGRYTMDLNKKWLFSPAFFYQSIGPADEMAIQVWGGYRLGDKNERTLRFGTGYRLRDAAKLLLGYDYKDLRLALAYDINLSSLTRATNTVGGFEIAANYIIKIYKQPEVTPVLLCPRL